MKLSSNNDNNIKNGRIWLYLDEKFHKNICLEWSLKINPFNFCISLNGDDNSYTFTFWFIFTFYITISNVFKYYPNEWNSVTNNGNGGYINSAVRKIGITQYNMCMSLYIWHDGESSYYEDKCDKIWYKYIDLFDKLFGGWCYHTIEEKEYEEFIHLNEGNMPITIRYRYWEMKYKRFYMKIFNHKGKSYTVTSNIKYTTRKQTKSDIVEIKKYNSPPDELERTPRDFHCKLKQNVENNMIINKYKDYIIKLRSCEDSDWVPFEYRAKIERDKKISTLLKE